MLLYVGSSASIGKELAYTLADSWKPFGAVCPEGTELPHHPVHFPLPGQEFHFLDHWDERAIFTAMPQ